MYVAIIGERTREITEADYEFIRGLISSTLVKHPDTVFLSMGCNLGVGKIVKVFCGTCARCAEWATDYLPRYNKQSQRTEALACPMTRACERVQAIAPFVEMSAIMQGFDDQERGCHIEVYMARNLALIGLADIIYAFVDNPRNGMVEGLIARMKANPIVGPGLVVYDMDLKIVESHGLYDLEDEPDAKDETATQAEAKPQSD